MEALGIIRKIDELGRIGIPKEIRKNFNLKPNDPLEIFTEDENKIIIRKYSPFGRILGGIIQYIESISEISNISLAVVESNTIVICSGLFDRKIINSPISSNLSEIIKRGETFAWKKDSQLMSLADKSEKYYVKAMAPIMLGTKARGAVMSICSSTEMLEADEAEIKQIQVVALFLGKRL